MNRVHDANPVGFPAAPTVVPPANGTAGSEYPPAPRPVRRRRRSLWGELWRWLVTALVFVILAGVVILVGLVAAVYWQARTDQARAVDAIVVLGAAQYNGVPGPVLQARLDQALQIYRNGYAPAIVVTGGRAPGDQFTEAEAGEMYLLEQGVSAAAIVRENEGRDSWQSMQGVAELLHTRGDERVLLVSDGFHLLRVKLMARDLGLEPYGSAALDSPIRLGGPAEFSYAVREAFGIIAHLINDR